MQVWLFLKFLFFSILFLFFFPFFFPGEKLSGVLGECQPHLDVFQVEILF